MFVQTEVSIKRHSYEHPIANESVLPEFKPISDEQIKKINEIIKDMSTKFKSTNGKRKGRLIETIVQETEVPKVDPTKVYENKKDDEDCSQGGTCEFFFYCWMVGGLLEGSCGGLLKSCCHRVAKAGLLGVQDSNSIEYTPNEGVSYGPVINDESKCYGAPITPLRNRIRCNTEAVKRSIDSRLVRNSLLFNYIFHGCFLILSLFYWKTFVPILILYFLIESV